MKKIFILTGEPSGDKLAAEVIKELKKSKINIEYLSVGGQHLNSIGIKSIYDQKDITYIAFTDILLNIFKIKRKINETVKKILDFNPDILFSVDSPDFTLRVSKIIKLKKPNIKTIHFIAPKVWAWREGRVKKMKSFLDHILLLFNFEKKYFDKEKLKNTFVGHPILDNLNHKSIEINELLKGKIISIFPGSRLSELKLKYGEDKINYIISSPDAIAESIKESDLVLGSVYSLGKNAPKETAKIIDFMQNETMDLTGSGYKGSVTDLEKELETSKGNPQKMKNLKPFKDEYDKIIQDRDYVESVLIDGASRAKEVSTPLIEKIRKMLSFFALRTRLLLLILPKNTMDMAG